MARRVATQSVGGFKGKLAVLVFLVPMLLSACSDPEPISIGFVGGLSGRVADLGIAGRNGAILAVEEINAAGGINGQHLKLIIRDDEQNSDKVKAEVQGLLEQNVTAIIGPMTSSMTVLAVPLVNDAAVPLISPTATTDSLAGIDDHFFRVISPTLNYATKNARYQYKQLGKRRIAAVYDIRNKAYTKAWLDNFKAEFEKLGGTLVSEVTFASSPNVHFNELAEKLLESKPDGVLILSNSLDAALICQQVKKLDGEMHISTSEWAATERLIELGGAAVEGVLISQFFDRNSKDPAFLEFKKAFRDRFNQSPGFGSITGYDAVKLLAMALAKNTPGLSLKNKLATIRDFDSAQGRIQMTNTGDADRKSFLTTVRNGQFVVIEDQ